MQREILNKVLSGKSLRSIFLTESIDFKSWGKDSKVKSYHFDSIEDLKAAWEKGEGVPDDSDPVADVVINGKSVYVGANPESIEPAVLDDVWFEDILTYCDIDIWGGSSVKESVSKPDLSSLGPNGLAVVKSYINHFGEQAYDDVEIGPEVDKCHPGWAFIILGNQEPAIMKAGKDISKKERDVIIQQIENW